MKKKTYKKHKTNSDDNLPVKNVRTLCDNTY